MKHYLHQQNENLQNQINELQNKIQETLSLLNARSKNRDFNYNVLGANFTEKREELQLIQEKINFYKEAIAKLKGHMDNVYNINK